MLLQQDIQILVEFYLFAYKQFLLISWNLFIRGGIE